MDLVSTHIAGVFESRFVEDPRYSTSSAEFIAAVFGGASSSSGETVTLEKALAVAAMWQVVHSIAQDIANLPIGVYRRTNGEKKEDRTHPASKLLRKRFSPDLPAYDGRVCINLWALLGNGYLHIRRDGKGEPIELRPFRCEVELVNGRVQYFTRDTPGGERVPVDSEDVVHVKGPSWDGFCGADVLLFARDILGQYLSAQKYTGRFFKNGAQSGGVYEIPMGMKKEAADRMIQGIDAKYSNPENWFKSIKLVDGVKWQGTSFDPQKAQLIEQKNAFAVDVCRFFNMSPAMIGVPGYSSYNSMYEANEQYLDRCLAPRLHAEKIAYESKLLDEDEWLEDEIFIEHNTKSMLRMSPKDEQQVIVGYLAGGVINQDEARGLLNLPPLPNGEGQQFAKLAGANNGGGANNVPANPNDPEEPGEDTLATQGKQAKADRADMVFCLFDHARSKASKPKAFLDWVDGGLKSHREKAERAGCVADFDEILAGLRGILERADAESLAAELQKLADEWRCKVV